jgi:DNA-directed RNA polymerase specialized sigma24 family protein
METTLTPEAASRLIAEWMLVERALFAAALGLCRARDVAEDLVQEVFFKLFKGDRAYDPEKHPDLKAHAVRILGSQWDHWRKSRRMKHETGFVHERDDYKPSAEPGPEEVHGTMEEIENRLARLREALLKESLSAKVLELFVRGIDDVEEQAQMLEVTKEAVYDARAHLQKVKRRLEGNKGDGG